ncbi:MAG TPA: AmmeMemoRadiSam system radical SAM enzyme [Candidatus Dormibacteraeota bacterium]|nr:AmmeMemoRadiSam system radical SAM enzyme [Candidatus Dormibacteraeota bacterium]
MPPSIVPALVAEGEPAVPAVLAEPQPDGSVRCLACAHRCLLRLDRLGICGVRQNRDGRLVSLVHSRAIAVHVDPIEKKPLFHVAPASLAYSIATVGCDFHCDFCQNWEIAQAPRLGIDIEARRLPPSSAVDEAIRAGATSIAYTYVEPTVFIEYVLDTGRLARDAGLLGLYVTNGYATPEAVRLLAGVIDAANVDLKGFDDPVYRRICGATLAPVLDSLVAMRDEGIWVEVTTLVIPGLNDDRRQLASVAGWIVEALGPETPWHISRFFPAHRMLAVPPTPLATLQDAAAIGRAAGLAHVYVGNAPELDAEDTRCAGCDHVLIERTGYRVRSHLTEKGECPDCGRPLAGRALASRRGLPCG